MLQTVIIVIALLILTVGTSITVMSSYINKQKVMEELKKRVTEKQNYFKNRNVIDNLMQREEYVIKNNRISFTNDYIKVQDTKNSLRVTNINFSDILEVKKEYIGNVYNEFIGDKLWDGYAIVIVYSDANRVINKRICLKEGSTSMHDIVDSVAINTISNIIIDKIQKKSKK